VSYATNALTATGAATQLIQACQLNVIGTIRIVTSASACNARYETPISWNAVGPKGDPGVPGQPGTPGAAGAPGAPGKDVTIGAAGSNCANGGVALTAATGPPAYVCNGAPGAPGQAGGLTSFNSLNGLPCSIGTATGTIALSFGSGGVASLTCNTTSTPPPATCTGPPPAYANAVTSCINGVWTYTCMAGFADADKNPANGCEINLKTDPANCGALGNVVSLPHAVPACVGGQPAIVSCQPGWFDANGIVADGCELAADGLSMSFASATLVGTLNCGQTLAVSGNTYPVGSDKWVKINVGSGCGSVTLNLTGVTGIRYDVLRGAAFPPAAPGDSNLQGIHTYTSLAGSSLTVRIYNSGGPQGGWTLTGSA
jgi:hypothetical protein